MASGVLTAGIKAIAKTRRDEPFDEQLLALFRNRAALKKEHNELRNRYDGLKEKLRNAEAGTRRAEERLEAIERLMAKPEAGYNGLVYFQLRTVWRACNDQLKGFVAELARQQEDRERQKIIQAARKDRDRRLEYIRDRGNQARDAEELEEGHRALKAELEFQKGVVSLRKKSYQKAVAHFEKAVNGYPEEGEYHAYYGWALYLEDPEAPGRIKEALERVLQGRKLAPGREKPYLFLGRLYKAANRDRIAEKMFTRAVQLDPDCVEALRELRLLNMRRERSRGLVRRILRR